MYNAFRGSMTNRFNEWTKKRFRELREERGNRCNRCGSTLFLQFAHISETGLKGTGRGRKERLYDIIKNPEAYILACRFCHELYDAGKIDNLNPQSL